MKYQLKSLFALSFTMSCHVVTRHRNAFSRSISTLVTRRNYHEVVRRFEDAYGRLIHMKSIFSLINSLKSTGRVDKEGLGRQFNGNLNEQVEHLEHNNRTPLLVLSMKWTVFSPPPRHLQILTFQKLRVNAFFMSICD